MTEYLSVDYLVADLKLNNERLDLRYFHWSLFFSIFKNSYILSNHVTVVCYIILLIHSIFLLKIKAVIFKSKAGLQYKVIYNTEEWLKNLGPHSSYLVSTSRNVKSIRAPKLNSTALQNIYKSIRGCESDLLLSGLFRNHH